MIFVTVGTQLPFDRLINAMDKISSDISEDVIAQIGNTNCTPVNMKYYKSIDPRDFDSILNKCRIVVSHAGIGSILTARRFNKPIIIVPRVARLSEHRNDHQLATAKQVSNKGGIFIANSNDELEVLIKESSSLRSASGYSPENELSKNLKEYISQI